MRRAFALLMVALAAAAGCATPSGTPQPGRLEWIDVHAHLVGRSPRDGTGDYPGAVRAAIAAMDDAGIRTAVIMPPPQTPDFAEPFDVAEFAEALRAYPGRFAFLGGGGTLNVTIARAAQLPRIDAALAAELERAAEAILAAGAAGFGEMAAHHLSFVPGHPYEWVVPDHPLLLLLADVAGRHESVIDLHLDLVPHDIDTPARFRPPANPPRLRANLAAFERLLAHNRKARIVWAHAGSDPLGHWTPALSRTLLAKHPNLYMSLRFPAGLPPAAPMDAHFAMDGRGRINPEWQNLVLEFPDRFVLGGDQFFASASLAGSGPGLQFARLAPRQRDMTRAFLAALPPEVARKLAYENAQKLYRLRP